MPVLLGVFHQSGAHRIQVDVGCHRLQRLSLIFYQHALEPLGPQRPEAIRMAVEPPAEALFELLHEHREVAHASQQRLTDMGIDAPPLFQPFAGQSAQESFLPVEFLGPFQEFGIGEFPRRWHPDEQMEMVGHHAIGDDLQPAEGRKRHEDLRELLPAGLVEQLLPANRPRDAMVHRRTPRIPLDPRQPHAPTIKPTRCPSNTLNLSLYFF